LYYTHTSVAIMGRLSADLEKASIRLQQRQERLDRCMQAMAMTLPKALVWQRVRTLHKTLSASEPDQVLAGAEP